MTTYEQILPSRRNVQPMKARHALKCRALSDDMESRLESVLGRDRIGLDPLDVLALLGTD
jgi:hypothetical protein